MGSGIIFEEVKTQSEWSLSAAKRIRQMLSLSEFQDIPIAAIIDELNPFRWRSINEMPPQTTKANVAWLLLVIPGFSRPRSGFYRDGQWCDGYGIVLKERYRPRLWMALPAKPQTILSNQKVSHEPTN